MRSAFYLERFKEHKEKGLAAWNSGDGREARYNLLKASEWLFKLAKVSDGKIREERTRNAQRLVDMARSIDSSGKMPKKKVAAKAVDGGDAASDTQFRAVERPTLRLADVAGLEDAKEQIRLKMIYPFTHPDLARSYGVSSGGGVLLYGPPGTGKTMIARAIAGEIEAAFFTVKPSEIMSKYVGEAEQNIARLFDTARAQPRSIVFLDEIEALVPARREAESGVMQRLVPQVLAELEGFDTEGRNPLLFIGATNEPWALDPAMLRPGRFDARIYVGLPDFPARKSILQLNLAGKPLAPDVDLDALAARLQGYSGADIRGVCRKAAGDKFLDIVEGGDAPSPLTLADLAAVLAEMKPSVSRENLTRFEAYVQQFG